MKREYHKNYSPSLNRDMEILTFGEHGQNFLVFPTSMGKFYEYENSSMVQALSWHIENGLVQLTCVDSFDTESWYNYMAEPRARIKKHLLYDRYILDEVIPFVVGRTGNPYICTTGCSFGGFHAVNFAFRHPDVISKVISLSSLFDIRPYLDGYFDLDCYFNSPIDFMPNMDDEKLLELFRRMKIILVTGENDFLKEENFRLSGVLNAKGIPHVIDVWGGADHHWYWWEQQIRKFV